MNRHIRNRHQSHITPVSESGGLTTISTPKAGWRISEFAQAIGCCRATVYNLIAAKELDVVKVRTMTIIRTDPAVYLAKAAEQRP